MRRRRRLPLVLLNATTAMYTIANAVSCDRPPPPRAAVVTTAPTTHPADWNISVADRERIITGLRQVSLGDSRDRVVGLLGTPDASQDLRPKGKGQRSHGWFIRYDFRRYENGLVNEKWDQRLDLIFDTEGRLVQITSSVADIPSRP